MAGGRAEWPPGEGVPPGTTPEVTTTNSSPALIKASRRLECNCVPRQCSPDAGMRRNPPARRPADPWLNGYCRGFLAALVDVARAVDDPEVWVVLDRVGENFTLPGGDR